MSLKPETLVDLKYVLTPRHAADAALMEELTAKGVGPDWWLIRTVEAIDRNRHVAPPNILAMVDDITANPDDAVLAVAGILGLV